MSVVTTDVVDGVAVITMDRPEALNAFNNEMFDDLCDAFLAASVDDAVWRY